MRRVRSRIHLFQIDYNVRSHPPVSLPYTVKVNRVEMVAQTLRRGLNRRRRLVMRRKQPIAAAMKNKEPSEESGVEKASDRN